MFDTYENYRNLACAIITTAVIDYKKAYKSYLKSDREYKKNYYLGLVNAETHFFMSDWFKTLSDFADLNLKAPEVIEEIQKRAIEELNKKGNKKYAKVV